MAAAHRVVSTVQAAPVFSILSWAFVLIPFSAGLVGGYQFPLANRLVLASGKSLKQTAGFLYGFDLAGSAAGAVLTSAFLIPILGIYPVLILLAVMNGCCWLILWIGWESKKQ